MTTKPFCGSIPQTNQGTRTAVPQGRWLWLLSILNADSIGTTLQCLQLVSSLQYLAPMLWSCVFADLAWAMVEKEPCIKTHRVSYRGVHRPPGSCMPTASPSLRYNQGKSTQSVSTGEVGPTGNSSLASHTSALGKFP